VVGPVPAGASAAAPAATPGAPLLDVAGDWTVDLNGKQSATPLKSWEALGTQGFAGPAVYRKQFDAPAVPAGKRVYLEIADVRDYARVKLNGKELEGRAWQPYRWDVTSALKAGANDLEIQVNSTAAGRGFAPPPAQAAVPGAAAPPPAPTGGRGRGTPPVSGLLGPVRLVVR